MICWQVWWNYFCYQLSQNVCDAECQGDCVRPRSGTTTRLLTAASMCQQPRPCGQTPTWHVGTWAATWPASTTTPRWASSTASCQYYWRSSATVDQSCPWVHCVWPDPTQPISWLTQPNPLQVEIFGPYPFLQLTMEFTSNKFFGDRSRGVDSVGGRKLPSPIDKASRR